MYHRLVESISYGRGSPTVVAFRLVSLSEQNRPPFNHNGGRRISRVYAPCVCLF